MDSMSVLLTLIFSVSTPLFCGLSLLYSPLLSLLSTSFIPPVSLIATAIGREAIFVAVAGMTTWIWDSGYVLTALPTFSFLHYGDSFPK